jgi:P27 family predicted phage terminase small subunit
MPNRPIPTPIRKLRGNPSRRPYNDDEPEVKSGKPTIPAHVKADDEAAREWRRVTTTLHEMGVLSTADRAALAAYCIAWSRWVDAETKLRQFGVVIRSPNDYPMPSPYLTIARDALNQMTRMLLEFGLTPASRTKLHTTKAGKTTNDFEAWELQSDVR